jgi:hypothetical protein
VPGISFALDVQPVFNANCAVAFCHVPGGQAPMSLLAGASFLNLVNSSESIVKPGNSADSYLIQRLTETNVSLRMPRFRAPLDTTSLDLIKAWIDNGALDN